MVSIDNLSALNLYPMNLEGITGVRSDLNYRWRKPKEI